MSEPVPSTIPDGPSPEQRLTELEQVVCHLQLGLEQLDEVLRTHAAALQTLKLRIDELQDHAVSPPPFLDRHSTGHTEPPT